MLSTVAASSLPTPEGRLSQDRRGFQPVDDKAIAVTGVGVVCATGSDREQYVEALREGRCGIFDVERVELDWLPTKIAGEVKTLDPIAALGASSAEMTRADAFAVIAAEQALAQSRFDLTAVNPYRIAVAMGTCQANLAEIASFVDDPAGSRMTFRSSADVLAEWFGARGERLVLSNACTAGATSIAVAMDKLLAREIDVAIVGGTDELYFFTLAGFTTLQSLDPVACAPYSRSTGVTVGEGAGILVLERASDADARGARTLAHLLSYGLSADGYHPTAPDPTGRGALLAARRALRVAGVDASEVNYLNGHGTGTPANDAMERQVLRSLFGPASVPMSSTKSMIGHLLGAAGAVEALTCVIALDEGFFPPTVNVADGASVGFDCVPNRSRPAALDIAISNNYAFGGANSSLLLAHPRVRRSPSTANTPEERVLLTGIGPVGDAGIGLEEWRRALDDGACVVDSPDDLSAALKPVSRTLSHHGVAPPDAWRKMDSLSRLAMVSARYAWDDASLELSTSEKENTAVILATAMGSMEICLRFAAAAKKGRGAPSAKDFPHTSMNSAAGHICTVLGLHGPVLSLSNGGIAGLSAIDFAANLIRRGHVERALVTSVDEVTQPVLELLPALGYPLSQTAPVPFHPGASGTRAGTSAVTLVLESATAAYRRSARAYAEILRIGVAGTASSRTVENDLWSHAFDAALERSGVSPSNVDFVAAAAGGLPTDNAESAALRKHFGSGLTITSPKSVFGECLASSGPVNVLTAVLALRQSLPSQTRDMEMTGVGALRASVCLANALSPGSGVATIALRDARAS